jgi:hypothetical protein
MVIAKISSLASLVFVFAIGIIFLRQAYGSSIGSAGIDVGTGLTGTATGVTTLINSFLNPITGLINTFSGFFGSLSNGSRAEPEPTGREDRKTPTQKIKSSDTSKITWGSGVSATVPTLSPAAKSYYSKLGVNVS